MNIFKSELFQLKATPSLILGLLAATLLVGCATGEISVATHYNEITGLRTDLLENNLLVGEEDPPRELIWLNASRVYRDFRNFDYFLEINYMAFLEVGFLDIRPGPSLTIICDGEESVFRGSGSANLRRTDDEFVHERVLYKVTDSDIGNIAGAKQVTVRVTGFNGIVERKFNDENFQRFIEFDNMFAEDLIW